MNFTYFLQLRSIFTDFLHILYIYRQKLVKNIPMPETGLFLHIFYTDGAGEAYLNSILVFISKIFFITR